MGFLESFWMRKLSGSGLLIRASMIPKDLYDYQHHDPTSQRKECRDNALSAPSLTLQQNVLPSLYNGRYETPLRLRRLTDVGKGGFEGEDDGHGEAEAREGWFRCRGLFSLLFLRPFLGEGFRDVFRPLGARC